MWKFVFLQTQENWFLFLSPLSLHICNFFEIEKKGLLGKKNRKKKKKSRKKVGMGTVEKWYHAQKGLHSYSLSTRKPNKPLFHKTKLTVTCHKVPMQPSFASSLPSSKVRRKAKETSSFNFVLWKTTHTHSLTHNPMVHISKPIHFHFFPLSFCWLLCPLYMSVNGCLLQHNQSFLWLPKSTTCRSTTSVLKMIVETFMIHGIREAMWWFKFLLVETRWKDNKQGESTRKSMVRIWWKD